MVASDYKVAVVNTSVGSHVVADVFHVSKVSVYDNVGGGVCLFFNMFEELIEVIASEDDIVLDASLYRPKGCMYYCMLYDEKNMTKEYVIDLFNGIRDGEIQVISTIADKIRITMSNN
jgi:hypothetical protein